jgi:hypothetical protein
LSWADRVATNRIGDEEEHGVRLILVKAKGLAYPATSPLNRVKAMLHANTLLADALAENLMQVFGRSFGTTAPRHSALIGEAARLVIERLSLSDALYHDAEHTALVTLVAQDILRGRRLRENVSADAWLHVILAALTHDIGYVRGVCPGDDAKRCVVTATGPL